MSPDVICETPARGQFKMHTVMLESLKGGKLGCESQKEEGKEDCAENILKAQAWRLSEVSSYKEGNVCSYLHKLTAISTFSNACSLP